MYGGPLLASWILQCLTGILLTKLPVVHEMNGKCTGMLSLKRLNRLLHAYEAADKYLRAMLISAACTSGMGKFSPCAFNRKNKRVAARARKELTDSVPSFLSDIQSGHECTPSYDCS
jgi:hypothetical protein